MLVWYEHMLSPSLKGIKMNAGFKLLAPYIKGFLRVVWAVVKLVATFLWVITSGVVIYCLATAWASISQKYKD